jgi:hypothetical protein
MLTQVCRSLVPLDFAGVDKKAKSEELRSVIEKIPTDKDQLFNYTIDWDVIDQVRFTRIRSR